MHIDMDAFFASVEQLDNPELRGKPVAVGGSSDRGVCSAASYEARRFGVRSALSVVKARQLCPELILVPGRMGRYKELSGKVMAVLHEFSPVVEQASVDEAYLDATGLERLFGPIEAIGRMIKERVRAETGLTCSVGAAPIRFLAKIASDLDKPDGLSIIHPHEVHSFLRELPVGKIPGVGKKMREGLKRFGVYRAGDLLRHDRVYWEGRLGKSGGILHDRARGIDPNPVEPVGAAKSCSAENTFHEDTGDRSLLRKWLLAQSERVGADLRRHGYKGRTVTLKVKFSDFRQITRSHSLESPTDNTAAIFDLAVELLEEVDLPRPVRLIGVGVSNFGDKPRQMSLFEQPAKPENSKLDRAVDAIREKFGASALTRAELLEFRKK
ncbi:DNA polymerase IV [Salidesulfovibrio onnuriiensis]|uniref:DNA polymerase IV n=1 Tax=Salidesulfovibrio onnuriiensis TaxID=2583823 RepID=UPI0016504FB5|nr:DNA polymerase IV [Salidesulfovibrio onnuriiensis]